MKILFVYKYEFVEPLGIMYLSSFLKLNGHKCYYIDLKLEKNYFEKIQDISPDIIAYSITSGCHRGYQKFNQDLKLRFNFFAIFGGPHCTFFPEFIYEDGVDAVCRGEGEFPLLELVTALENGKGITGIRNLWIKVNGKVYKNEMRNLIEDLDSLPFPDRELINHYKQYKKKHIRFILTGRGCPYNCTYCFNHLYNKIYQNKGKVVRKRTVDNLIKELKYIKDTYQPRKFQFMDDTFNLDYKWTLDFCDIYKREIKIPFIAILRINLVKEEVVSALKDAGCITIVTGIESGNEYLRNNILKRGISETQIMEAVKLFHKYDIAILLQNIVGLPDETVDMALETVFLNIRCKPAYSWVSIFQPYPMTELCEYSKQRGYFDGNIDSLSESFFDRSVMKMKDIKKIERLQRLFSLVVAFPIFAHLLKTFIRFPLDKFYRVLWNMHKTWCYLFRIKIIDFFELLIEK